jgi:hypothetical protein
MKDTDLLSEMFDRGDARALLDRAVSDLLAGQFNPRLMTWLALRLERVLGTEENPGEDPRDVFNLRNREGAPSGVLGSGRYRSEQVAAVTVLARRRFRKKGDADAAVAKAVGWNDSGRVLRHYREGGYDLDGHAEELLKVMAGDVLLSSIHWPN